MVAQIRLGRDRREDPRGIHGGVGATALSEPDSQASPRWHKRLLPLAPVAYFALLSVAVWGTALFVNGYVLLGDMVFTPAMNPVAGLYGPQRGLLSVAVVLNLAWLLSRVVGAVLLQKLLLLALVFLPGYLMYRNAPLRTRWGKLFAGTLYAVNPFLYTRLLIGHWGFLLGYALIPVALGSALKTARQPSWGKAGRTALCLAAITVLSAQAGVLALLAVVVAWAFQLRKRQLSRQLLTVAVMLVLLAGLCAFWLLPAFHASELGATIGRADLAAFATSSTSGAGKTVSVLGMYGFWKSGLDPLLPRSTLPGWPVFAFGFLLLAVAGAVLTWRDRSRGGVAKAMVVVGAVGFVLAFGPAFPLVGRFFLLLYDHLPGLKLFREPQKFAALLALAYAVLGGMAVDRFSMRRAPDGRKKARNTALVMIVLLLLVGVYSFRMFGGLWGQASAVSYPRSWSEASRILDASNADGKVLFLPPHWYMSFAFTGHDATVANPMPFYFTYPAIHYQAIQVGAALLDVPPLDRYVRDALVSGKANSNLGAMLAPLGVRYLLLAENQAAAGYSFVLQQRDLEVVRRWDDLVLLRNRVETGRLFSVSSTGKYVDWLTLGDCVSDGDLLGARFVRDTKTTVPRATGRAVPHQNTSGGGLVFDTARSGLPGQFLFAEQFDTGWRLDGRKPSMNLGLLDTFDGVRLPAGGHSITFDDPLQIAGYAVSGAFLLLCGILLLVDARKRRGVN